ncbi:hypothetical protein P4T27_05640 [Bacillus mobilis]|uniref:hypothetical protein n=1 Tax=Bacillus mobilis TaxID=2026190 RepID=UPI002EB92FBF|nr:hypothetical protein [Bacillus mobilis]MED0953975.1 hypothetical protein [Bacillus mobilis]
MKFGVGIISKASPALKSESSIVNCFKYSKKLSGIFSLKDKSGSVTAKKSGSKSKKQGAAKKRGP